jgi:hypothetical protein
MPRSGTGKLVCSVHGAFLEDPVRRRRGEVASCVDDVMSRRELRPDAPASGIVWGMRSASARCSSPGWGPGDGRDGRPFGTRRNGGHPRRGGVPDMVDGASDTDCRSGGDAPPAHAVRGAGSQPVARRSRPWLSCLPSIPPLAPVRGHRTGGHGEHGPTPSACIAPQDPNPPYG